MKKLIPAYILSFVICFMLFVFEPITMYSSNIDDLWFDFSMMIFPLIKLFLVTFIGLSLFYSTVYFIFSKKLKKPKIYQILLVISFILFIVSYIQGNYLAGNLPVLNGKKINWNDYNTESLKSIAILLFTFSVVVMLLIKLGYEKVINGMKFVSLGIFAMLAVSLTSTLLTTKTVSYYKDVFIFTRENIDNVSTDKNFIIFLVDAVDSREFNKVLNESDYKDTFDNFTYYPDTMAAYPYTRDSIPFILSGIINENEEDFSDYSTRALSDSTFLNLLKDKGYDINIYDYDIVWNSDTKNKVANVKNIKGQIDEIPFYKQEFKYVLFKYLPFYLKKYSRIERMDYNLCKKQNLKYYDWRDSLIYDWLKDDTTIEVNQKNFHFIHIEGGHVPFDIDENFNYIEDGTYDQKLMASLKLVNLYINRLKDNDLYDNSVIIVMADHGFNMEDIENVDGRQNPILYIKGIDEHHEMIVSDKPISYFDLLDAYMELLDGKKSTDLFSNIDYNRKRRYLWYLWTKENHMYEYEQSGKAWDLDTLVRTGKEFVR